MATYYEKNKERLKARALRRYHDNKEQILIKKEKGRRAKGIKPRKRLTVEQRKENKRKYDLAYRKKVGQAVLNKWANNRYHANLEKRREYNRKKAKERRERDPIACNNYAKGYYEKNKELIALKQKEYYRLRKEKQNGNIHES